jgi:diguanylate cyclase (GGDEF)-like protein
MNVFIAQIVTANRIRARLQDNLAYQATHDSLTSLPNRAHALELIEAALHRAQRSGTIIGLLFVDVDNFKVVNDTFGHGAGDEVLRMLARRMQADARAGDMVARLAGDEFVVLLENVDTEASVVEVANRIVASTSAPIIIESRALTISISVGVAVSADGGIDADRLLADADAAVYRAKSAGRNRVEIFDDALRREMADRVQLEAAIVTGLRDEEFVLYYQPVVRVCDRRVDGYEALIRWERPGYGVLPPGDFIPIAEASPLICDLGAWVLHRATHQLAVWTRNGHSDHDQLSVAVNISGRHLSSVRILDDVSSALRSSGIAPGQLILEITETLLIDDPIATRHLSDLRAMGVKISIDDFGTGYTSIAQLQYLPVDSVKIDRSFLNSTHSAAQQLIELMIRAAHAFGLEVIAEGVERREQLDNLALIDCEYAQGFYLARPMPADMLPIAAERTLA